ncbi:hypothetical protein C8R44DRAFT_973427 [Mycena epipterygia]|nr:hypothetical protein C8R44DRAFT_973427 [Mycena epipterygia]
MPLTRCPDDVFIEILADLTLKTITDLMLVQKAWKGFIETYEENIYHNAAIANGLVSSSGTSLTDEKTAFDPGLNIGGWKTFCRIRVGTERNWAGLGPSSMTKVSSAADRICCRKSIPDSNFTIISSLNGGIAVYDKDTIVWALPEHYVRPPAPFVYDNGYLVFQREGQDLIEIWQDQSRPLTPISTVFPPNAAQEAAATSSLNSTPYFRPAAALPAPSSERPITIRLAYPTLFAATSSKIYVWDIQTGELIRSLGAQNVDDHIMQFEGLEVSRNLIVAFDQHQLRFFSHHDGLYLFFLSHPIPISGRIPRGVQLSPPQTGATPSQCSSALLLQQTLFRKSRRWFGSREHFTHIGISPCDMTLAVLSSNRRMLIVNDIHRVIKEDLPIFSAAVDVKIGREYGLPLCLAVTRDRIAVGTDTGILVLTLDRSRRAHGPRPHGSIRFCQSTELDLDAVQLNASFVQFQAPYSRMRNLEISGTKLLFNREPDTRALPQLGIPGRRRAVDNGASDTSDEDSMPDLQSVSNSSDDEDPDESDHGDDGEDPWWDLDELNENDDANHSESASDSEDSQDTDSDDSSGDAPDDAQDVALEPSPSEGLPASSAGVRSVDEADSELTDFSSFIDDGRTSSDSNGGPSNHTSFSAHLTDAHFDPYSADLFSTAVFDSEYFSNTAGPSNQVFPPPELNPDATSSVSDFRSTPESLAQEHAGNTDASADLVPGPWLDNVDILTAGPPCQLNQPTAPLQGLPIAPLHGDPILVRIAAGLQAAAGLAAAIEAQLAPMRKSCMFEIDVAPK